MRRLVIGRAALDDLKDIARNVGRMAQNRRTGAGMARWLRGECERLALLPGALGRPRPEFAPGLRSFVAGRYLIFFRYAADRLEIVAIVHGARDLPAVFADRKDDP